MPRRSTKTLNLASSPATPARRIAISEAAKMLWGIPFPGSRTEHRDGRQYLVFQFGRGNILVERETSSLIIQHATSSSEKATTNV